MTRQRQLIRLDGQISSRSAHDATFKSRSGRGNRVRGKTNFVSRFNSIEPFSLLTKDISIYEYRKSCIKLRHPASAGGAYRDRHGRGSGNAMDAAVRSDEARSHGR
jgi:hypothetical protein